MQTNPNANETDAYLAPDEAARITGLSVHTLAHYRMEGLGPAYHRIGGTRRCRILYARRDIDAWMSRHRRTTSESRDEAAAVPVAPRRLPRRGGR